ncbi:MAG: TonB-dependent receptor [Leadbetterella sp.]|nr:TonB-dependent receptor [Leadbetterella sp.]
MLTPRVGISYSIKPDFTLYALYDRTLVPQTGTTAEGNAITPMKGENREVGIKSNWLGGRWTSTLSVYSLKRTGIVSGDPDHPQYRIQVGETGATGFEIDLMGEVIPGLNAVLNYAYTDAEVKKDVNEALIGGTHRDVCQACTEYLVKLYAAPEKYPRSFRFFGLPVSERPGRKICKRPTGGNSGFLPAGCRYRLEEGPDRHSPYRQ